MAVCARAVQQPDGSFLLALDPSVTDVATCAYVVETGADVGWQTLSNMSISDAQVIGSYVVGVWAIAWGVKQVGNFLSTKNEDVSNE